MPSKASEFKKKRQAKQKVVELLLPSSGLTISVRRPAPAWFLYHQSLPRTVVNPGPPTVQDIEDVRRLSEWVKDLLNEVIVAPKISLNPTEDEISPADIDDDDLQHIIKWAMGEVQEVDGKSTSLAEFPEKPISPGTGIDGEDVEVSPV